MKYQVTYRRSDLDTLQRRHFADKEEAIQYATMMTFDVNDLYFDGVTASDVKLWAIQETYHDITERIYL